MKVHELHSQLTRKGLGPLYLVLGEEPYFRDQALRLFRRVGQGADGSTLLEGTETEPSSQMFSSDVLYGDETDASEILAIAEEVSFFSSHRLVLLKWADKLSAREGERLLPYLKAPNDSTTLVLAAAKLDGRTKWVQELKKQAVVGECSPLFENQRVSWVAQRAREFGVQ